MGWRLQVVVSVAAVLSACAATVVTWGAPADFWDGSPAPGMPVPALGDHVRYEGTFARGGAPVEITWDFLWDPARPGHAVGKVTGDAWGWFPEALLFQPHLDIAYGEGVVPLTIVQTRPHLTHHAILDVSSTLEVTWHARGVGPFSCLVRAGWQGIPPAEAAGQPYLDVCPQGRVDPITGLPAPWSPDTRLAAVGEDMVGGRFHAFRLRADAETTEGTRVVHDWWLSPGIPYPLRFQETRQGPDGAAPRTTLALELVGYAPGRGGVPWGASDAPSAPQFPLAPAGAGIPVDPSVPVSGFDLAEAIRVARTDPRMTFFHQWMNEHPDAILLEADFEGACGDTGISKTGTWKLAWAAPQGEGYGVWIERTASLASPQGGPLFPEKIQDLGTRKVPSFPREGLPQRAMTIPVALGAWQHHLGAPYGINSVSYHFGASPTLRIGMLCSTESTGFSLVRDVVTFDAGKGTLLERHRFMQDAALAPPGEWKPLNRVIAASAAPAAPEGWHGIADATAWTMGGGLLLMLLMKFWRFLGALTPFSFYTRHRPDRILDNETRRRVFEEIQKDPGIHSALLASRMGISESVLRHHLKALRWSERLSSHRHGRRVHWFVAGTKSPEEMARLSVIRSGPAERVLEAVEGHPGASIQDVACACGLSRWAVLRALQQLESVGLVLRRDDRRKVRLYRA